MHELRKPSLAELWCVIDHVQPECTQQMIVANNHNHLLVKHSTTLTNPMNNKMPAEMLYTQQCMEVTLFQKY